MALQKKNSNFQKKSEQAKLKIRVIELLLPKNFFLTSVIIFENSNKRFTSQPEVVNGLT
jgi:hypothetical protein